METANVKKRAKAKKEAAVPQELPFAPAPVENAENLEGITIQKLHELMREAAMQKHSVDELEMKLKVEKEVLQDLKAKIQAVLEQHDMRSYSHSGIKAVRVTTYGVSFPKDPVRKEELFDYLRSVGAYDNLISVNSRSLYSFYKEKIDEAAKAGNINWVMPGVGEPTAITRLDFKRG